MKRLVFLFTLSLSIVFLSSCGDDGCTLEDWEGTYRGVKNCDGDITDDYLFEISQADSRLNTGIDTTGASTTNIIVDMIVMTIDNCSIVGGEVTTIGLESYEGTLENGEVRITLSRPGSSCTWIATKI